jgi:hypothetical protein
MPFFSVDKAQEFVILACDLANGGMIFANLIQITDSTLQYVKFGKKLT